MEEKMFDAGSKYVILTGPESTGKSAIGGFLSKELSGRYIPEFAREYIGNLGDKYGYADILNIANRQVKELEFFFNQKETSCLFVDTYLVITKVWFRWKYGEYPLWIDDKIKNTKDCLYLLCAPDIVWQDDLVRENGGEARKRLFAEYESELIKFDLNYKIIKGVGDKRFLNALHYVKEYI